MLNRIVYKNIFRISFFIFLLSICTAQNFTIAVIPDTQCYTNIKAQKSYNPLYPINQNDIFVSQMEFIRKESIANGGNILFAIHLGDLVERRGASNSEWNLASSDMEIINNVIPYGIVPGNHDYDQNITKDGKKSYQCVGGETYNSYFGPESIHFKEKKWYGGSYNSGMNSWSFFFYENQKFLFLGLEIEPADDVLEWAQNVIDQNKGIPTILVTHEYLSIYKDKTNPPYVNFIDDKCRDYMPRNSPRQLWNKLIRENSQIFMILCGHVFNGDRGEGFRVDINDEGYEVYAMLSNYQGRRELIDKKEYNGKKYPSGDGWLRLLDFDLDENNVHVKTYSPYMDKYEVDENSDFIINFQYNFRERFFKQQ